MYSLVQFIRDISIIGEEEEEKERNQIFEMELFVVIWGMDQMTSTVYMFINRLDSPAVCCSHNMDNDGFSRIHMAYIMYMLQLSISKQRKKQKIRLCCLIDVLSSICSLSEKCKRKIWLIPAVVVLAFCHSCKKE
jgi:hypothetical protein